MSFTNKYGEKLPGNFKFKNQNSYAVALNGELNASNKDDLIKQIGNLITASNTGAIKKGRHSAESARQVVAERKEILDSALSDTSGSSFKALGEVLADEIYETMGREGLARRLLSFKDLGRGEVGRIRFRKRNVTAWVAASASEVTPSIVRDRFIYPPEFYVSANILLEERDISQSTGDILEEKYEEGLEETMVAEDRLWKKMADGAAILQNTQTYFTNLTPTIFSQIKTQVANWGIPVTNCVLAYDLWNDIIGHSDFSSWFDPVTKHDLILEGYLGSMLGVELHTDAFRIPELKVLNPGEIYFTGAPQTHGQILQRGDMSSNPVNSYNKGKPERGWYLFEIIGMAIVNAKSVATGKRV